MPNKSSIKQTSEGGENTISEKQITKERYRQEEKHRLFKSRFDSLRDRIGEAAYADLTPRAFALFKS